MDTINSSVTDLYITGHLSLTITFVRFHRWFLYISSIVCVYIFQSHTHTLFINDFTQSVINSSIHSLSQLTATCSRCVARVKRVYVKGNVHRFVSHHLTHLPQESLERPPPAVLSRHQAETLKCVKASNVISHYRKQYRLVNSYANTRHCYIFPLSYFFVSASVPRLV